MLSQAVGFGRVLSLDTAAAGWWVAVEDCSLRDMPAIRGTATVGYLKREQRIEAFGSSGEQSAHTSDTVAVALKRPAVTKGSSSLLPFAGDWLLVRAENLNTKVQRCWTLTVGGTGKRFFVRPVKVA